MVTTVLQRQPTKLDYAEPTKFRFSISKLPKVEYFCTAANIPGISLGSAEQPTPLKDIPIPGDKLSYDNLEITFLIDENLENYREIHGWLTGIGFPKDHSQFRSLVAAGTDRYPTSKDPGLSKEIGQIRKQVSDDGGIYSDATLTVLNSKNIAKTEIRFRNVYPTSLGSLSYDIKASDVDYLTVQATFNYLNYDIVQLSTT